MRKSHNEPPTPFTFTGAASSFRAYLTGASSPPPCFPPYWYYSLASRIPSYCRPSSTTLLPSDPPPSHCTPPPIPCHSAPVRSCLPASHLALYRLIGRCRPRVQKEARKKIGSACIAYTVMLQEYFSIQWSLLSMRLVSPLTPARTTHRNIRVAKLYLAQDSSRTHSAT
ncbi:hypothetical protein E2C01_097599 [Portunus trituberculatus]|uniref:Uncharacterized protein n=1 Tax=Portunus trituberculatus TaxID=210409 RepID=A0A5B7K653_PORTR|nr:hypothetical protein [Portunus trituberculatus]